MLVEVRKVPALGHVADRSGRRALELAYSGNMDVGSPNGHCKRPCTVRRPLCEERPPPSIIVFASSFVPSIPDGDPRTDSHVMAEVEKAILYVRCTRVMFPRVYNFGDALSAGLFPVIIFTLLYFCGLW